VRRVPISFTPTSSLGDHPQTGGGRKINAIVEQIEDGRKIIKRAPGLVRWSQSVGGNTHVRGMIAANSGTLLVVYDDEVESFDSGGVGEVRGALSGSDLVTLARNNATTPDVVGVSPSQGAFVLSASGSPGAYPDADVQSPVSVCFTGGYFFFMYGDRRCRASGLNATSISTLDEIRAESGSGAGLRCVAFRGQLFLFCTDKTEVWQGDQPNASGFPFNRATVIERGIASTNAVAGWEDKFAAELIWVGQDNMVYQLRGYDPYRISTPTIERDLQGMTDKSSLRCFVSAHNGHPYVFVKSATFTHVYDLLTATWQERNSYGLSRTRMEQCINHFGDWIMGDELTGDLWRLDADTDLEGEDPLVWEVESDVTSNFPMNAPVKRADFNFVGGAGREAEQDPTVAISWSDNGGTDYGTPLMRSLGEIGQYGNLVTLKRCGRMGAHGRRWKMVCGDQGYVGLLGGAMFLGDK
jgi:hypothetical protein